MKTSPIEYFFDESTYASVTYYKRMAKDALSYMFYCLLLLLIFIVLQIVTTGSVAKALLSTSVIMLSVLAILVMTMMARRHIHFNQMVEHAHEARRKTLPHPIIGDLTKCPPTLRNSIQTFFVAGIDRVHMWLDNTRNPGITLIKFYDVCYEESDPLTLILTVVLDENRNEIASWDPEDTKGCIAEPTPGQSGCFVALKTYILENYGTSTSATT